MYRFPVVGFPISFTNTDAFANTIKLDLKFNSMKTGTVSPAGTAMLSVTPSKESCTGSSKVEIIIAMSTASEKVPTAAYVAVIAAAATVSCAKGTALEANNVAIFNPYAKVTVLLEYSITKSKSAVTHINATDVPAEAAPVAVPVTPVVEGVPVPSYIV